MALREWSLVEQKTHREMWASALESGRFKQCRGQLCKVYNGKTLYCAMGVLEVLSGGRFEQGENPSERYSVRSHSLEHISLEAARWVGLYTTEGNYIDVKRQENRSIMYDNDAANYSFKTIAKIIRSSPRRLFVADAPPEYSPRKARVRHREDEYEEG